MGVSHPPLWLHQSEIEGRLTWQWKEGTPERLLSSAEVMRLIAPNSPVAVEGDEIAIYSLALHPEVVRPTQRVWNHLSTIRVGRFQHYAYEMIAQSRWRENRTADPLSRLEEELAELRAAPDDVLEMGDVLFFLLAHAADQGVSFDEILAAGVAKLSLDRD